jgi:hypothetical protein
MNIEVKIPIKAYLKKFISKNHPVEPFIISTGKCHLSALILDPIKKDFSKPTLKVDKEVYTDLRIIVPTNSNKFWFDEETVLRINQRLKSLFDQQLCDMVSITNERKGDIFKRVKEFTDYYNITEDELKFETIVKMYYRARYPEEREKLIKEEMIRYEQLSLFTA